VLGTPRISRFGIGLCLAAGLAFAVQPILGTIALDRGAAIVPMLGWRYLIAAIVLAVIARRALLTLPLRVALSAFGLGLVLYTADSFLFYSALERTSAPFATLLHYGHLAVVVGVAAFTGREQLNAKRLAALVTILGGIALVGGGAVSPDVLGLAFALASAGVYAVYILASDRLLRDVDPIAYSAVLTSGAAVAFMIVGGVNGELTTLGGMTGVSMIVVGAFLGSVFALTAFLAGIRLIGPGTASLLVTIEVPLGLTLAAVVLGDRLSTPQLAGAALVVFAIAALQLRLPSVRRIAALRERFVGVRAARRLAADAA
jgi:drug/metabolite transporter (DMT)-like permease